jgi:hypothetical protein
MQELSNAQSAVNVDVASPPIEFVEEAVADTSEPHSGISGTAIAVTAVGIGAVAFEAALLRGVILGVAAMWLPHDVRQAFAPLGQVYGSRRLQDWPKVERTDCGRARADSGHRRRGRCRERQSLALGA